MPSCRLLPHGSYTLVPAVFTTIAWLASLAQDGCDYVRLSGPSVEAITKSSVIPYIEIGFVAYREPSLIEGDDGSSDWKVAYSGACIAYDSSIEDGYWKAAKGFAFASLVLGGASALFLWFSSCFVFSKGTWRWAGYQVVLAFFCQCLSFLWFGTDICSTERGNKCSLFFGSRADIAALFGWLVSSVLVLFRYPSPLYEVDEVGTEEQQIEDELPVAGDPTATLDPTEAPSSTNGLKPADGDII